MSDIGINSTYAPEALYDRFEDFVGKHVAMVRGHGMDYVLIYMLVRLIRDDIEKGRRVFSWAVKRVCLNMLADSDRFRPVVKEISPQGRKWAQRAEDRLGVDPLLSLSMIETIFLIERLGLWAELALKEKFPGYSLVEFRARGESNEEVVGKIEWLDYFYQTARQRAFEDAMQFVRRRDTAIALAITALASGKSPVDEEIDSAMHPRFPTHQSQKRVASMHDTPLVGGKLAAHNKVVEWVLGPYQRELEF